MEFDSEIALKMFYVDVRILCVQNSKNCIVMVYYDELLDELKILNIMRKNRMNRNFHTTIQNENICIV